MGLPPNLESFEVRAWTLTPGRVYELSRLSQVEVIELFEPTGAKEKVGRNQAWTTGRTVARCSPGDRFLVIEPAPYPWEDVWIVLFKGTLGACIISREFEMKALLQVSE